MATPSRFLNLPPELRDEIYSVLLHPAANRHFDKTDDQIHYHYHFINLYLVSKQVHEEAERVFRRLNQFAKIETPFPEAEDHIHVKGNVPLIATGDKAKYFKGAILKIKIDAPEYTFAYYDASKLIIHVDDVKTFASFWMYADLSHRVNENLALKLTLRDPWNEKREGTEIHRDLQRKCLEPFGVLRDLQKLTIEGDFDPAFETKMREEMKKPYDSPQKCLEECMRLKNLGNSAMKAQKYDEALKRYIEAFKAMHVICVGHKRSVWAESYFQGPMEGGEFDKQQAEIVRLSLRITLVANVCQAYLKMKNWAEVKFWGMRTIMLMRQAMGLDEHTDEALLQFTAANQVGKIYYRTGIAERELGDDAAARKLLRIAVQYLPGDTQVQKDLASVALKIG